MVADDTHSFRVQVEHQHNQSTAEGKFDTYFGLLEWSRSPDLTLYPEGASVELLAVPNPGNIFVAWAGDIPAGLEAQNPLTLTLETSIVIQARFAPDQRRPSLWRLY